ncbi:MAG: RusA family crossover junction endodeoxyribonuclease [Nitrososphaerales archaeon]
MELKNIPIPPSVNHMYRTLPNYRRCKTKYLLDFEKDFELWVLLNKEAINTARKEIKDSKYLKLDLRFYLKRPTLFCLNNTVKKMDISNRIKAVEDAVSNLLGIDDSLFFQVSASKEVADKVGVTATITPLERETIGLK